MSDDLFETELSAKLKSGKKKSKGNNLLPMVAILVMMAVGAYFILWPMLKGLAGGGRPAEAENSFSPTITDEDTTKRQLTSFVEQFLMVYYNYSYTLYDTKVREAETMMTPAFQAKYSVQARNLDFKRKLESSRVSTDAIRILPNSFLFQNSGIHYFVKLSGVMVFTTGVNGVSGEFPINLLLAIDKTDAGFLVDNVERTR